MGLCCGSGAKIPPQAPVLQQTVAATPPPA
jgi:hypothetical protein